MSTIYLHTDGALLHRAGRRLLMEKQGQRLLAVKLKDIGRILAYGKTTISANAIETLLAAGIPIYYAGRCSFRLRGQITPCGSQHIAIRQGQYHNCLSKNALELARELVRCKLTNMEAVIFYLLRRQKGSADFRLILQQSRTSLSHSRTADEMMGVEGAAARHYFALLGSRLPAPFQFRTRSRRPATDPANALLNLGYMTLFRECHTHLEIHGIDPYCSVLHSIQDNRASLALDFMEQFRQPLVDLFILKILRREQLTPKDFQQIQDGGIRMTPGGLANFFRLYRQMFGEQDGIACGLRKIIDDSARQLKLYFLDQCQYQGFELAVSDALFANQ